MLWSIWVVSGCFPDSCRESEELEERGVSDWLEVSFAESGTTLTCCGGPEGK